MKRIYGNIPKIIEEMSDTEFAKYDTHNLTEYFYNKLNLNPLLINEEDKKNPLIEMHKQIDMMQFGNSWYGVPGQPMYHKQKVENIYWKYSVRLTGNFSFLYLRPLSYAISGSNYNNLNFNKNDEDKYATLSVTIVKSVSEAGKSNNIKTEIYNIFLNSLKIFEANLSRVNNAIMSESINIKNNIRKMVEARRNSLNMASSVFEKFNIPLNNNQTIKFAMPLIIHKKEIALPKRETQNQMEYSIDEKDFDEINNLIFKFCSTMERTPKTYLNSGEEDIRNTIIAALNTQYSNATGETFSNRGKTDIFIGKYDSAAYIAECKLWKGKSVFLETINQLLRYTTYKECHGTILFFNKTNRDFNKILNDLPSIIESHEKFSSLTFRSKNCFHFNIKRDDGSIFKIQLMVFNFYYEENLE